MDNVNLRDGREVLKRKQVEQVSDASGTPISAPEADTKKTGPAQPCFLVKRLVIRSVAYTLQVPCSSTFPFSSNNVQVPLPFESHVIS
jgi:hypothetical protein